METILKLIASPFVVIMTFGTFSIILLILIVQLRNKNKEIRVLKEIMDYKDLRLYTLEPFESYWSGSYPIYNLSNALEQIKKIKENSSRVSDLFNNASKVFCEKFEKTEKFSEINSFLVDLYKFPHLYEGLISGKFFKKTHKKVRELTEQYFEELKLKKDKKALQDLLETLKIVFGNYEDLYALFYHRINKELSLPA